MDKLENIGCRVLLNPNGSSLRCGDKVNAWNWNPNEGVMELCTICNLKKQNASLLDMLNRQHGTKKTCTRCNGEGFKLDEMGMIACHTCKAAGRGEAS